jgi:hypothetical protein
MGAIGSVSQRGPPGEMRVRGHRTRERALTICIHSQGGMGFVVSGGQSLGLCSHQRRRLLLYLETVDWRCPIIPPAGKMESWRSRERESCCELRRLSRQMSFSKVDWVGHARKLNRERGLGLSGANGIELNGGKCFLESDDKS